MKLLIIYVCLFNLLYINSDIPTHCLKSQVAGKWKFSLTAPQIMDREKNIEKLYQLTCGHQVPSHEKSSYEAAIDSQLFVNSIVIELKQNNEAILNNKKGIWTMVYDEGFDINFEKKAESYFAFLKYGPNNTNGKFKSKWVSYCYATLNGWFHNKNGEWGCFKAVKEGKSADEATNGEANDKLNVVEGWAGETKSFLQRDDFINKGTRFMEAKSKLQLTSEFKDHALVVEAINSSNLPWTAKVYPEFENMTIREMNHKLFGRRRSKHHSYTTNSFIERNNNSENQGTLPATIDYSKYMGNPKSQGNCGSCFAVASINSLEARFRLKYGDVLSKNYSNLKDFSISLDHVLQCSIYNQGCDGGYVYLVGKFFKEYEVVPKECYQGCNGNNKCSEKLADLELKVLNYYYVGGFYGASTHENIMRDLARYGPLSLSFEPQYSFSLYKSGIYTGDDKLKNKMTNAEWTKVDHSMTLVGYGEEPDKNGEMTKYWLLQNSWGEDWGDKGYIKFLRGENLSGIETIAEAIIPFARSKS